MIIGTADISYWGLRVQSIWDTLLILVMNKFNCTYPICQWGDSQCLNWWSGLCCRYTIYIPYITYSIVPTVAESPNRHLEKAFMKICNNVFKIWHLVMKTIRMFSFLGGEHTYLIKNLIISIFTKSASQICTNRHRSGSVTSFCL